MLSKTSQNNNLEDHLRSRFGVEFADLYEREGLLKIDQKFFEFLAQKNVQAAENFSALKKNPAAFSLPQQSTVLIDVARFLEDFLVELFDIKTANESLKKQREYLQKIYVARREFVQRVVAKKFSQCPEGVDGLRIVADLKIYFADIDELEKKLAAEILAEKNLELLENYAAWALYSQAGRKLHKDGVLFILPQKIDHQNLVEKAPEKKKRDGFDLTDNGFGLNRALAESHYCIFCHKQEKDSCRKGFEQKIHIDGKIEIKINPLGIRLEGCPLNEKISEMNLLKSQGSSLAALAIAALDNPMLAGTGHRICNDCMKSCIYQKQEPVDIPQVETRVLKDVLAMPYGFEIYSLLTRWNPLNLQENLPKQNSGKKVLVCGLGPAGYTLAHYLLNDGHEVVAIDGLKIEPLNSEISGVDIFGARQKFRPVKFLDEIYEPLSSRVIAGFGGVVEYGITSRFDKNFLKVIRLLLERRKNFRMFGGLRFGSSITDKIAFEQYGFDHVALCIGAGRPNIINIKNNFAKGIRMASDFLMSLQLTGAFKEELFTNLQVRMPALVIGGGLTAVDVACEVQAYYLVQIKKFAKRVAAIGREKIFAILSAEEKKIAEEFLRDEEKLRCGITDFCSVKILYRKKMQDSPAYRLNHQELEKAFEEGVEFVENVTPLAADLDEFGAIKNLLCADEKIFAARSLFVAAGTSPNLSPVIEDGLDIPLAGKYFKAWKPGSVIAKIDETSKKALSFFGDLHPLFEGNVVKAMASAKVGYQEISKIISETKSEKTQITRDFAADFLVKIGKIERLSSHVVEVFVKAPLLARQTKIGQIFRLQNYHAFAQKIGDQLMAMEGVAVTALSIDQECGVISGIVVETGGSTSLIKNFRTGEPCIFMGPSGAPTEIPQNEKVVLIGGGRGNQPLTTIAEAFSANGCEVIFFAGYRKNEFIVRQERMENSCAKMIFATEEEAPNLKLKKPESLQLQASVIDAIKIYLAKNPQKIDRIFAIGNDAMMHEVAKLRHQNLVKEFAEARFAITSLNAPMQCMMKGVCSQCLQKRVNEKGEEEFFYSCASQDQNTDKLDFTHLHARCEQNALMEKTTKLWIESLMN